MHAQRLEIHVMDALGILLEVQLVRRWSTLVLLQRLPWCPKGNNRADVFCCSVETSTGRWALVAAQAKLNPDRLLS